VKKEEGGRTYHLTKYAFDDKKKEMKIYVDLATEPFKADDEILESMITFEPSETSFVLKIVNS
jgi:hypothetical protein